MYVIYIYMQGAPKVEYSRISHKQCNFEKNFR